ncbi:cleavage and polyadenylation specificity factor subunit 2 [Sodiomyces alkalinus F11]|uniref:Cleavage and polyadenylation specificity factor subunit 2 n=1 Tax=Sodiomyces alkalinus (strain CBS 110278 / VKM F-3762 / F11) TaxID=1314773 RepID=A0A3N2PV42_SODAK|nr:cleavage and polyadenylation specificity factor subunit 2 [Sodiomyces alkalinus F11]ROT38371.1 cleavage and polyadenylation specificity factor subunit 2 [Sodiomyces alkalinus F11]
MFTFCPLQGAQSESTASQSILELDGGVKVLIDIGWDESFHVEKLRELEKQVPTLSLILLTHATTSHLAAFAHCCKNIPLFTRIPVYATRPVIDLGRTLTQDLYSSTPLAATTIPHTSLGEAVYSYSQQTVSEHEFLLQAPTPEEITRYFSLVQALKYSQPHEPLPSPFSPPLNGLTITAYNAGHTLGGTIWHIQHGLESIVYAVDWNQARENVFAGAAWLGGAGAGGAEVIEQLRKPTALVCSSRGADKVAPPGGRAKRDEQLVDMLKLCLSRGGTALIPVDSSARVLELAYLLEHAWRTDAAAKEDSVLKTSKLYLAGRNMSSALRYARSMLEWMDDNIVREFEATADGLRKTNGADGKHSGDAAPFDFRHVRLVEKRAQIEKLLSRSTDNVQSGGRVILASDASLDWGFSKDLLRGLARDSRNLVVLTDKPALSATDRPSLARTLWEWWKERRDGVSVDQTANGDSIELVYGGGRELTIDNSKRQALEGEELTIYQQWLATQRQLQATLQTGGATALEAPVDAADEASSESSSDSGGSDNEQQGRALNISTTMGQATRKKVVLSDKDLGINILTKKRGASDFDVRNKRGRERSFPLAIRRRRDDQFGDMIRPEDYLRAEEKEEDVQVPDANADADAHAHAHAARGNEDDNRLGKKRKWEDNAGKGSSKRPNRRKNGSTDDQEPRVASSDGPMADDLDDVEEEDVVEEGEEVQGPAKLVRTTETVMVNLRIGFVDCSGLHDKRTLNNLIPLIQPRKLILVGGTREETKTLATDCRKLLAAQIGASDEGVVDVFTPETGELVDASVDTNAWVVKLSDSLVRKLKWQNFRGLGVVTITGQLVGEPLSVEDGTSSSSSSSNKRQKTGDDTGKTVGETNTEEEPDGRVQVVPTLDTLPMSMASAVRAAAQPLHVGDLRLTDLRRALQGAGFAAEFRGEGTLVVNGSVAVRKTGTGKIDVEAVGVADATSVVQHRNTLYEVKRMIYDGLAVVAGA